MKKKKTKVEIVKIVVLVILCVIFLMPIFYLVMNSFKSLPEILTSFTAFPTVFTLDNYIGAAERINFLQVFINTLILTVGTTIITVFAAALAGYKLQRTKGKISGAFRAYFMMGLMIPFAVIMVPLAQVIGRMGITNNLVGLFFVYTAQYIPMMVMIYSGYCKTVPLELDEAATIDGCNSFQTFTKVILPLTTPMLVTMAVLAAVWTWNDLLVALISINDMNMMTLTRRVQNFIGFQSGTEWDFFTAAVSLDMIPIIVVYIFMQKKIQAGLTSGAVKG